MFFPIGDIPNPPGRPYMTYAIIALNIALFGMVTLPLSISPANPADPALYDYVDQFPHSVGYTLNARLQNVSAYDLFLFKHAYKASDPGAVSLLLSLFLHGGWMHLFGNMLFLWIYGDNVEHRLGAGPFLFAYLATGAAATLFYSVFSRGSAIPLIGASGAISGVLGFYYRWFPKNRVKVMLFIFPFFMDVILVPARWVLAFYLIVENLLPVILGPRMTGGGVAYNAHIGGFVAGLAVAYALDKMTGRPRESFAREHDAETDWFWKHAETRRSTLSPSDVRAMVRRREMNEAARAYRELESAADRLAVGPDDVMRIGDYLLQSARFDDALTLFRRHVADYPAGPYLDWAYLGAGLALMGRREFQAAYQYFLQVLDVKPAPRAEAEARRQIALIESRYSR